jgi:transposase
MEPQSGGLCRLTRNRRNVVERYFSRLKQWRGIAPSATRPPSHHKTTIAISPVSRSPPP